MKTLFTVAIKKTQINFYGNWLLEISSTLSELLNSYGVNHRTKDHNGTGDWHFQPIKNKNDFQKLKNFLQEYKEKFSERNEIF